MNLLILALLAQGAAAKPALDRYATFAKALSASQWEIQVSMKGAPTAMTELLMERGKSLRFDSKWYGQDYTIVESRGNAREIERNSTTYDELSGLGGIGAPQSRISGAPGFSFPNWAFRTDLRIGYGKDVSTVWHGRQTVAGKPADVVEFIQPTQMGKYYEIVSIAPSGAPIQVSQRMEGPGAPKDAKVWTVTSVTKLSSVPRSALDLVIPGGYVPYAFERENGPIAVGKAFPTSGWVGPSGKAVDLKTQIRGKATLLAMLGQNCAPSARSEVALKELSARGIAVVRLTDATTRTGAAGRFYDPEGKKAGALAVTATPTFFLVDSSGKIKNLWMGYDPDNRDAFEKEVRDAVAGKTE